MTKNTGGNVAKLESQIKNNGVRSLVGNSGYRRYLLLKKDAVVGIDQKVLKEEARYDGQPGTGHIMVCFLALALESALRRKLLEKNIEVEYIYLLRDLQQLRAVELTIGDDRYLSRTELVDKANEAFRALCDNGDGSHCRI